MAGLNIRTDSPDKSLLETDPLFGPLSRKFREACILYKLGKRVRVHVTKEEKEAIEGILPPEILVRFGNCEINLTSEKAQVRGEPVYLTREEYELIRVLTLHSGEWMTFDSLIDIIECSSYRSLINRMSKMRKKLDLGEKNLFIQAGKYGSGSCCFVPDKSESAAPAS